ncbi:hypothetical protein O6P43_031430 [Quillaja saponaria]|uniref:Uncharacterized protein n=1 Tax=Quillaja saponaria TaxID=32244 RepID=A0AAD7P8W2_QUISA|nr:hypothetical protein O6P43_031430 [Quillaja saponaria]
MLLLISLTPLLPRLMLLTDNGEYGLARFAGGCLAERTMLGLLYFSFLCLCSHNKLSIDMELEALNVDVSYCCLLIYHSIYGYTGWLNVCLSMFAWFANATTKYTSFFLGV